MSEVSTIKFGGRDRVLKYKPSVIRDFENVAGETLTQALPKRGYTTLAGLLWVGFKHDDDRLSVAKCFDYLDEFVADGGDIAELWDEIARAMIAGGLFGKPKGKAQA